MLRLDQELAFPVFLFNQTVGVTKLGKVFIIMFQKIPGTPGGQSEKKQGD